MTHPMNKPRTEYACEDCGNERVDVTKLKIAGGQVVRVLVHCELCEQTKQYNL